MTEVPQEQVISRPRRQKTLRENCPQERLQKIISRRGFCSRRKAEEYIREGKVKVNGRIVTELGTRVSLTDAITIGRKSLSTPPRKSTWAFCKPTGILCSMSQDEGRPTIFHFIPKILKGIGLVHVGRLDLDSQGLLLLTNDGELAFRLSHPRFHTPKGYEVKIRGHLSPKDIRQLEKGIYIPDYGRALPAKVKVLRDLPQGQWIQVEIYEGKNRQIRKMCEALGHQVSKLKRVYVGPIRLGKLKEGAMRELTKSELSHLYKSVSLTS